ncbi:3-phosphoshikimate 1-carboxyvinyltransferase [Candidatus Marithrix sp. Canyon 246]|uniref:3-phosphoshikimate 1-carboxyvinyltransferase n=1 Tax=Candidatus Marithrix sp. Canyon 246 TaxID=1827136 RepID=UPI00084A2C9B|nr:3-phosphoshikimate 1-carboxyvinyltransferase [Candidatus Marithrix sp. Canyon 246]
MSTKFIINPGGCLRGSLRVPGDKSISHRSIMLGALAEGTTEISGFLEGEDTLATLAAFQTMGVNISRNNGQISIQGVGLHGLKAPNSPLYLGNSGTSMRLLSGLMVGQNFSVEMTGDASLSRRPMRRVTKPLSLMGANISTNADGTPPLKINGNSLQAINYNLPIASAQVKSAILLAGLYANGKTCVTEPAPTRDHTERMLAGFGYSVTRDANTICLQGGGKLQAHSIDVPADISSAAFFIVAACIAKDSELSLTHVGINATRIGIINILQQMGADISLTNQHEVSGELVADIHIRSSQLHGIHIPPQQVPLAIDEFPAIFIAAACAEGKTVLTGAAELRVKESDRIQVMADGLNIIGIKAEATADGMIIQGGKIQGGIINSHGDHRIAMAFTIAALRANETITVTDCANVATSFPNFVKLSQQAGINLSEQ